MKKVQYQIGINCKPEKVFSIMLDEQYYREWTAVFNPTSHFKGSWKQGEVILFLGEDQDGEEGGMHSLIEKMIPNEFLSIKHLGMLEKGKKTFFEEDYYENYHFEETSAGTMLKVEMDTEDSWADYLDKTWPDALQKLKEICEKQC